MQHWFERILFQTRARPETPAMLMEDRVVTYAMLATGIGRCAARIVAANVAGEGPIAVLVKNPIRHITLCLALHRLGRVSLSLEHGMADLKGEIFAAVVGDNQAASVVDPKNRIIPVTDDWFVQDLPDARLLPAPLPVNAVCRVSLTSGTTGTPRRVTFRSEQIGQRILQFIDLNWSRVLCMPGLSSSFGFTTACAALSTGRSLAFAESPFQAIRMIELFSLDFVMASTEQVLALTRVAKKTGAHLPSLRTVEFAGSVASKPLIEAAALFLCRDLLCRYGASETGVMARVPAREMLVQPGLVGEVVPEIEIMIVDPDGRPCKTGDVGLVKARMRTEAKDESWIDLGDLGRLDANGRLFIFGRADDASDVTSAPIADVPPIEEIEHLVRLEWDMADAAAAIIKGQSGSKPNLCVGVVQGNEITTEGVCALLQARGIDHPAHVVALDAIPRTANGKVNRERLKAALRVNLS